MVKKGYILLVFWLISFSVLSQNLLSFISVSPENAYIGQPVQLKVSVYTSTWFTKGVNVGNIQVDGALTVYFRSVSNTQTFNGKKYSGVDFYYNLFPTDEGILTIPGLTISVESPKEGGYKGINRTVKTKSKTVTVKGVPLGYDPNNWLVSTNLNVTEKWSSSLSNVKVGDVIQRTISRSASGTLSEFFPETKWDSVYGISIYPSRPIVNTKKTRTNISASRLETVSYLFEKEGEINIPPIEYLFWNSNNKKFYKKRIDSISIQVKPNADLAMLVSIKKSLQKEKVVGTEEEEKAFLILGLKPKEFVKSLVFLLIGIFLIFKTVRWTWTKWKKYRTNYLISEKYSFNKVTNAIEKDDINLFIIQVNTWLSKLEPKSLELEDFKRKYGSKEFNEVLLKINKTHFKNQKASNSADFKTLKKELIKSRLTFLQQKRNSTNSKYKSPWLNPTI